MVKTIKDIANSMVLMGSIAASLISFNTSNYMQDITPTTSIEYKQEIINNYNSSTTLKEYFTPKQRLRVEIEADNIFGEMRPATVEEQKSIMEGIKSISKPVGINFWDLC